MWADVNPDSSTHGCWGASSLRVVNDREAGTLHAHKLREWTRVFVDDWENLPVNPYGKWIESILDKDLALTQEIHLHLHWAVHESHGPSQFHGYPRYASSDKPKEKDGALHCTELVEKA
jgi:hypothetical protein